jgi:hypothetical protein
LDDGVPFSPKLTCRNDRLRCSSVDVGLISSDHTQRTRVTYPEVWPLATAGIGTRGPAIFQATEIAGCIVALTTDPTLPIILDCRCELDASCRRQLLTCERQTVALEPGNYHPKRSPEDVYNGTGRLQSASLSPFLYSGAGNIEDRPKNVVSTNGHRRT